jgi:predicted TIM-barrel fold metal-dependent hydrolase
MRRWLLGSTAAAVIVIAVVLSAQGPGGGRGGTRVGANQECPPGTTEIRPGICQSPEFPAPSILDYRPRSTLVTVEHKVPKAKFPVVDIHGHGRSLSSPEGLQSMIAAMDALNLRVFVSADNSSGDRLATTLKAINASPYKDRFRLLAGVNFSNVGPGWAEQAVKQLEADIKAGAVGVGEVSKAFGLFTRKRDGSRLKVDDPDLDPLWAAFARLDVPVFIHTAEPQEFFQQPDMRNERWLELALFADRRNYQPGQVKFDELMTERNNLFRKHPKTRFIAAHFGWHANDLQKAAAMLDAFPNVTVEVGAILYDLGRQPRAAHDFFIKYQDRQGCLAAGRVPVLLARVRDCRRILRLLPRLSRVLEAVRHGPAGHGAQEAVLPERAARGERAADDGVAAVRALRAGGAGQAGRHYTDFD